MSISASLRIPTEILRNPQRSFPLGYNTQPASHLFDSSASTLNSYIRVCKASFVKERKEMFIVEESFGARAGGCHLGLGLGLGRIRALS